MFGWIFSVAFTLAVIFAMCNRKFYDRLRHVYIAVLFILLVGALALNGPAVVFEIFTLGAAGHGSD